MVRGKGEDGADVCAAVDPAEDDRIEGHLPAADGRFSTFAAIDDAEEARRDLVGWGCTDARIHDADTGAVVPSYAEALARLAQIDAALAGAFAVVPCNNNQPRVFIRGASVELVRHRRALADMRLPDNVADAEDILTSALTALRTALNDEPAHPSRMTGDLQTYPQGAALHVVPELADEVDEHRATKEKLAEADKYIAVQDEQIEALEAALVARPPLTAAGPDMPAPDPAGRPESGPMRFGDDWAGVFLRGDYAGPMGMYLRQVLGDEDVRKRHPFSQRMLDGLAATLSGCDESGALDGLQRMRPFAECVATGPRLDAQPNGAATRPRATTWPADGAGATVTEPSAPGSADPAPR